MKKVILMLTLLALVVLCYTCAGMNSYLLSKGFKEGVAQPGRTTFTRSLNTNEPMSYSKCASFCANECRELGVSAAGVKAKASGNSCMCDSIPRNLSHVINVGEASTANECSVMAGEAGYLTYFYNPGTNRCGGERKVANIGTTETQKECIALAKKQGYPSEVIYLPDTKKCFGVEGERISGVN